MGTTYSQFFPLAPTLTEANLPSQKGKVFVVTGGASGVGFELCRILYQAGGKVYIAGRGPQTVRLAATRIKSEICENPGELCFLFLDLQDLETTRPAVERFTAAETRLDVLFNNAGVFKPPKGSTSTQGHELQMAANCLGPYLLTRLLKRLMIETANLLPSASVRVVWTSTLLGDMSAPTGGGITAESLSNLMARSFSDELSDDGILSVTQNPGNMTTQSLRHLHWIMPYLTAPLNHHPKFGAYTELYAGLSSDLGIEDGGSYIILGRKHPSPREDIMISMRSEDEGGLRAVQLFTDWCKRLTEDFR